MDDFFLTTTTNNRLSATPPSPTILEKEALILHSLCQTIILRLGDGKNKELLELLNKNTEKASM